jgi:hypothetical protein
MALVDHRNIIDCHFLFGTIGIGENLMYPKTFYETAKLPSQIGTCFVLMPFAEAFREVYDAIVQCADAVQFSASRADDFFTGGHIIEDILRSMGESEVIIADVTGKNPNVFYELGIAHMVKEIQNVLILTQTMDDIPFDLRSLRCIVYEQTDAGLRVLKSRLNQALRELSEKSTRFSVREGQEYKFSKRFLGADKAFYDFDIPELWAGGMGAKFRLRVYRYVIGQDVEIVWDGSHGLGSGDSIPMRPFPGILTLERVENDTAYFSLNTKK